MHERSRVSVSLRLEAWSGRGKRRLTFSSRLASLPSSSFLASLHLFLCSKNASLRSRLTPCGWNPAWYGILRGPPPPEPAPAAAPLLACGTYGAGPLSGERTLSGIGLAEGKGDWPGGTPAKGKVEGGGVGAPLAGEPAEARGGGGERAALGVAVDAWDRGAGEAPAASALAAGGGAPDEMAEEDERPLHWAGNAGREGCGARRNEPLSMVWFWDRACPPRVRDEGDEAPRGEGP